jgi:hypothetical protein
VGGRQDEEEGALLLVEWRFPPDKHPEMIARLADILGHPLSGALPSSQSRFRSNHDPSDGI